jgi:DNA polymerase-1
MRSDQKELFSSVKTQSKWIPSSPPSLDGISEIYLDCETTGLKWWDGDLPVGFALRTKDGRSWYLPWAHKGGGNLDENVMKRWAQTELRNKLITNAGIKFDIHMLRVWGVDLEEQGCKVSDVQHYAALLDETRRKYNLDLLGKDFLGIGKEEIDIERLSDMHAGDVAAYAEKDVFLVDKLKEVMWPKLDKQDLQRVRQLEDNVIFPVCEMEKNAAPINVELLNTWSERSEQEYQKKVYEIYRKTGLGITPGSPHNMRELFDKLGIEKYELTDTGQVSYADDVLRKMNHPIIELLREASKLKTLRSKYFSAYQKAILNGKLHYQLHQLRTDENGTVSGRFAASKINPQQVFRVKKQMEEWGDDYIVRQLFIPEEGKVWFSADADQIEYRLFAHFAESPKIYAAYKENENVNFHELIRQMVSVYKEIPYKETKDMNFAKIFGAGLDKISQMLDLPRSQSDVFVRIYNRTFPEANQLLKKAMRVAIKRGYVKTILGRRTRFPDGDRAHKALNSVIQGSAADIAKQKTVELHSVRKELDLIQRFPVHDENDGDCPKENVGLIKAILNYQSFPLKVPILWSVGWGNNWKECETENNPIPVVNEKRKEEIINLMKERNGLN